jgi:hypothetical protein
MGQFGRVFIALENDTGFLIAVKEILLPPAPNSAVREIENN